MKKISENEYKKAEVRIEELLLLTAITETDRYFSDPEIKMRISYSLEQAAKPVALIIIGRINAAGISSELGYFEF